MRVALVTASRNANASEASRTPCLLLIYSVVWIKSNWMDGRYSTKRWLCCPSEDFILCCLKKQSVIAINLCKANYIPSNKFGKKIIELQ